MHARAEVEEFIRSTFRSLWALELLGLLRDNRQTTYPTAEIVNMMRASDYVVTKCIENLASMGMVAVEADGAARYAPASPELDLLAKSALDFYGSSPSAVRRIIAMATSPTITAFADAFRLKKEDE